MTTYSFTPDFITYTSHMDHPATQENIEKYQSMVKSCSVECRDESIPYDLKRLYDFSQICELILFGDQDFDVTLLAGLINLRILTLAGCRVDLSGLEFISDLTELRLINVESSGMSILSCLNLELLWLKNSPIESLDVANKEKLEALRLQYSPLAVQMLKRMMPIPNIRVLGFYFYHDPERDNNIVIPNDLLAKWCPEHVLRPNFSEISRSLLENRSNFEEFRELVDELAKHPKVRQSQLWIGNGNRCDMTMIVGLCQAVVDRDNLDKV